jgi:hypothetical protein
LLPLMIYHALQILVISVLAGKEGKHPKWKINARNPVESRRNIQIIYVVNVTIIKSEL